MTVTVPTNEKTGAAAIAAKITALSAIPSTAPHYTYSQQLLDQTQRELVNTLLDQRKLQAALIISTLPVTNKSNAFYAKITAQNALITAYGSTAPAIAAGQVLDQLQRQLVAEEMANGQRTAVSILSSSLTYIGGAQQ